jgi:hypothetical protein
MLKEGSVHKEKHNPVKEYSNQDGSDILNPQVELAEIMLTEHKAFYGGDSKGVAEIIPNWDLGKSESGRA